MRGYESLREPLTSRFTFTKIRGSVGSEISFLFSVSESPGSAITSSGNY